MLTHEDVLAEFRAAGALLEGHFILSSGLHSNRYLQCARVLMDPQRAARLCASLAEAVRAKVGGGIDLVASPAMGGVVVGYEMGRQLGVPAIFFERVDGKLVLRRGFTIPKGARVLMVEDIVTTGLSSRECIAGIAEEGGATVGAAGPAGGGPARGHPRLPDHRRPGSAAAASSPSTASTAPSTSCWRAGHASRFGAWC